MWIESNETLCFAFGSRNKPQICIPRSPKRTKGNLFLTFVKPPKRCVYYLFSTKQCALFRHPFDRNQHSVSIELSFTNKAKASLRFFPPVINARFAPNHHSTNTEQHISLILLVRHQHSIAIEPSFYEQNNTFLWFLPSIISVRFPSNHHFTNKTINTSLCLLLSVTTVRLSPNHHFTDTLIHFFTSFRP